MPSKEVVFTIRLPIEYVWSFMTDRKEVGCLFPGCVRVKIINDLDSVWTVKFSLGPFSRTLEMNTHTTEMVENERLSWEATGEHMKAAGMVLLRRVNDEETEITYRIEGHVTGRFSMLQDIVVAEKLGEVARGFMKSIKERLEYKAEKVD
ncbi:MAG TPA: SRPBCC domain-containing protein [Nitrospirota bacterium]|nr:SRPBCC domain-containing protein [Nitrospirota bacterium]